MESDHIPHNRPTLGEEEIAAVEEVIRSGWIAQGDKVRVFENHLCDYLGLPENQGVALSSGSAALFVALKILDIPLQSEVIIPTYVCSALLNAVFLAGLQPVLADVEETDFNLTVEAAANKITDKTGAIIVPHMFGCPADISGLTGLGPPVIEDCATALGSTVGGRAVGTFGEAAVFSFYASKVIATGQGGMLVSKNGPLAERARDYREFDGCEIYYPRFNFHLSDLQATVGIAQLNKLPDFLKARNTIAGEYERIGHEKGWSFQRARSNDYSPNRYRFVIRAENRIIETIRNKLAARNIDTIVPIERRELLHNYLKEDARLFPVAERLSRTTLSLPIYPEIAASGALDLICSILREC